MSRTIDMELPDDYSEMSDRETENSIGGTIPINVSKEGFQRQCREGNIAYTIKNDWQCTEEGLFTNTIYKYSDVHGYASNSVMVYEEQTPLVKVGTTVNKCRVATALGAVSVVGGVAALLCNEFLGN